MKKLEEREYETRAVAALPGLLEVHRRVLAVGPTGSGKTVIGAQVVCQTQERVLWVAHRIELVKQAAEQLVRAGVPRAEVGVLSGTDTRNEGARVLVASVGMFNVRTIPKVGLFVIDEAHRAAARSYLDIVDVHRSAPVLGLTATPWRLDGKGLGDVFAHLYLIAGPTELIADGYIAKPDTYGVSRERAKELVQGVRAENGDYATGDLSRSMMRPKLMGDTVSECARLAPGEPAIVFAVNRKHARALVARFRAAGRRAEYLDAMTPKTESNNERARILADLASGKIEVVVNVDVLCEGVDLPEVKCIVLARPTKSLTRFLQQVGRASRPFRGKRPVILDHAGNWVRFGLPEHDRSEEWSLEDRAERGGGAAPTITCPVCTRVIPIQSRKCPGCGAELPRSEAELDEERAEMERLRMGDEERQRKESALRRIAGARGLPEEWVQRALKEAS